MVLCVIVALLHRALFSHANASKQTFDDAKHKNSFVVVLRCMAWYKDTDVWEIATPLENLGALGFHTHQPDMDNEQEVVSILADMPSSQVKQLAGNGMHLKVQSAWMLYCLSNLRRVTPATASASSTATAMKPEQVFGFKRGASDTWDDVIDDSSSDLDSETSNAAAKNSDEEAAAEQGEPPVAQDEGECEGSQR